MDIQETANCIPEVKKENNTEYEEFLYKDEVDLKMDFTGEPEADW